MLIDFGAVFAPSMIYSCKAVVVDDDVDEKFISHASKHALGPLVRLGKLVVRTENRTWRPQKSDLATSKLEMNDRSRQTFGLDWT